jgi:hypothetical protein
MTLPTFHGPRHVGRGDLHQSRSMGRWTLSRPPALSKQRPYADTIYYCTYITVSTICSTWNIRSTLSSGLSALPSSIAPTLAGQLSPWSGSSGIVLRHPRCYRFCYPGRVILGRLSAICGDEKILGHPLSVLDSVPCRVCGQEEAGRSASASRSASRACAGS